VQSGAARSRPIVVRQEPADDDALGHDIAIPLVIDLDGTLLNADHQVDPFTIATVRKLEGDGLRFVIATGRHYCDVAGIRDILGISSYLITSNGARIHAPDNTVIHAAGELLHNGDLALIFDCGTSDFFLTVNRNLHQLLLDKKIDHDYTERPGGHNGQYWKNSIDYQVLFFWKYFHLLPA